MAQRETRLIRGATLKGYAEAATAVGLNPQAMLQQIGLEPRLLTDPDTLFSFDGWLRLLAASASQSGDPYFGMRAAIARGIPDLGAVSLLMREAETLEEAIRLYTSHLTLHTDGTFIQLDKRFEDPLIVIEIPGETREQSIQATQFGVVGVIMQIRWLIGGAFQPELVSFSHPKPTHGRGMPRFFECPVSYGQILSGIVVNRAILPQPLVTSPPFLRKLALQHLEPVLQRPPDSFAARAAQLIRQMLEDEDCSADAVATRFGIDRRTLNRRLAAEGETFSSVLQQVRIERVRQALAQPRYSVTELAGVAGFRNLSSFSRWFHQSFGCTPSAWRKQSARHGRDGGA